MTAGARRIAPVLRQPVAYGERGGTRLGLRQSGVHAWGRRRHGQAEDVIQQPLAAEHGRCPIRIRGRGQQRAVREQSAALIGIRERHAPEPAAVNAGNPVVPRQPFVDERVVRSQKIDDAAIFAQRAGDEQLGLLLEGLEQAFVDSSDSDRDRPRPRPTRRRFNHWAANPSTSARAARGSASMRRTCCSSTAGLQELLRARPDRAGDSSGMLPHRKNDRREATSMSLRG